MSKAKELRREVEAVPDPDTLPKDDMWAAVKCANGEWVLGVSTDSHGMYSQWLGGGTVVLKDSRGRVRCFLGHVCGVWTNDVYSKSKPFESLDAIDAVLAGSRFAEHPWP